MLIVIILLLVSFPLTYASLLIIQYDGASNSIVYAGLQELNEANIDRFQYSTPFKEPHTFTISSASKILFSNESLLPTTQIDVGGVTQINLSIFSNESRVFFTSLTLCNFNGVCEPCLSNNCTLSENELSCLDCAPNSLDGYCHLELNDICDPDCPLDDYDCAESDLLEQDTANSYANLQDTLVLPVTEYKGESSSDNNLTSSSTVLLSTSSSTRVLAAVAFLFFIVIFSLILWRKLSYYHSEKKQLTVVRSYVIKLRNARYDDQTIKGLLLQRGYALRFVRKLFRSLERKP